MSDGGSLGKVGSSVPLFPCERIAAITAERLDLVKMSGIGVRKRTG